jgi:DNA repair protein RadA/Sms
VLGGGVVPGSLVLIGGEPGIGKVDAAAAGRGALREDVRPGALQLGEESEHQIKSRGARLGDRAPGAAIYILAETCLERILEEIARLQPAFVIVDSIQTVFSLKFQSAPGSIGQVREAATQLLFAAKGQNIPTFLVGHVTKDGSLAGPKALEHIVDTVLYFEGEEASIAPRRARRQEPVRRGQRARRVRDDRTRSARGAEPSQLFLAERPATRRGRRCCAAVEGSRPMLVESAGARQHQLVRQRAAHDERSRSEPLSLLLAVLEKRAGLNLVAEDVFVNVAGGISVDEPRPISVSSPPLRRASAIGRLRRRPRCSARWVLRERFAASRSRRCGCARRRRWASRAASFHHGNCAREGTLPPGLQAELR